MTRQSPRLTLTAALLLGPAAAHAQDTADLADPPGLRCTISGYDVVLTNDTTAPIPTGTLLTWSVPFVRMEGTHTLTTDLDPGRMVFMTSVLGANYLRATTPCEGAVATPDPSAPPPATELTSEGQPGE